MKMTDTLGQSQLEPGYNLQERLLLVLLLVSGVALLAGLAMMAHFLLPVDPRFQIGKLTDFSVLRPQRLNLQTNLSVYVVKLNDQIRVWDTLPITQPTCGRIQWVAANLRFEDPCTAGKWCLDGSVADPRIPGIHTLTEYPTTIEPDGTITISAFNKIVGRPLPTDLDIPTSPYWMPPDDIYYCRHITPDR